jgi:hypothetical protein
LNDFGRFSRLAGFSSLAIEAMARNRQSTMKVIQVLAVKPYRLLTAPAKPVRPGQIAQNDLFAVFAGLN